MERTGWTDERLDDLGQTMAAGFDRVDTDIRELRGEIGSLRSEMRTEFGSVRGEIGSVRGELRTEIGSVRGEIDALRVTLVRVGGGIMVGLAGVIAAVLAQG